MGENDKGVASEGARGIFLQGLREIEGPELEPCADVSISAAARRVILTGGGGAPIDFFRRRRRQ